MNKKTTSSKEPKKQRLTKEEEKIYKQALKYYEDGRYKDALPFFLVLLKKLGLKEHESGAYYYIKFCRNVLNAPLNDEDKIYERDRSLRKWLELLWIPIIVLLLPLLGLGFEELTFSFFSLVSVLIGALLIYIRSKIVGTISYDSSHHKVRCKYCGHYTHYIAPNEGFAYMDSNNCSICGRGYPMPSTMWDTDWGKAYMYERGSVTEPEFYQEWEEENPSYPKSEMADSYLGRKKEKN